MVDDRFICVFIQSEVEFIVIHWIRADKQFQVISELSIVNNAFLKVRSACGTSAVFRDCACHVCGGLRH